jgi:hypothetical protein
MLTVITLSGLETLNLWVFVKGAKEFSFYITLSIFIAFNYIYFYTIDNFKQIIERYKDSIPSLLSITLVTCYAILSLVMYAYRKELM